MAHTRPITVDRLLDALADPTRRQLYEEIVRAPGVNTSELAERTPYITRWGVMKHLEVLRSIGLIQTMSTGRFRRHYAEPSALAPLDSWLSAILGRR